MRRSGAFAPSRPDLAGTEHRADRPVPIPDPYYVHQVQVGCWERLSPKPGCVSSQPGGRGRSDVGDRVEAPRNPPSTASSSSPVTGLHLPVLDALRRWKFPSSRMRPAPNHALLAVGVHGRCPGGRARPCTSQQGHRRDRLRQSTSPAIWRPELIDLGRGALRPGRAGIGVLRPPKDGAPAFVTTGGHGITAWSAQSLFVVGTSLVLILALWLFFGKTLYGRALRAGGEPPRRRGSVSAARSPAPLRSRWRPCWAPFRGY